MTGVYKIADTIIRISSQYDEVHVMCHDYRVADDATPDMLVETTEADILREREQSIAEREQEGLPPYEFNPPYLETLAVYRKIASLMPARGVMLMHGSCIAVDGRGYFFIAASGTGKSTHVRLWRQLFGDRALMVNDDKPLIRVKSAEPLIYGTAWDGKHHLSTNTSVPLQGICVLQRSATNHIEPLTTEEAFAYLLQQTFRPDDPVAMIQTMGLLSELASKVKIYRLGCNMDSEAAVVASRGMGIEN